MRSQSRVSKFDAQSGLRLLWAALALTAVGVQTWVLAVPAWLAWHDQDPRAFYAPLPAWAWVGIVFVGIFATLSAAFRYRMLQPVAGHRRWQPLLDELRGHRSARQYLRTLEAGAVVVRRVHLERAAELARTAPAALDICYPKDRWMYPEAQ